MKKFELIDKSIFIICLFALLVFWSYLHYGYFVYLCISILLGCIFWFLGRITYSKYYFKFVFLIFSIILIYSFGAIYLTVKNGWGTIFILIFMFMIVDLYFSIGKINRMQEKYKDNIVMDGNLDRYSYDFEIENGKVWGDGGFYKIIFMSFLFIIGPYFIIINPYYEFYAGEMMSGVKSNLYVYAVILLILLVWEYTLKRIYFFSGLNYTFNENG